MLRNRKGFTLIELIVVIALLAIIAALAIPSFQSLKKSSAKQVCDANKDTIQRMMQYEMAADGSLDENAAFIAVTGRDSYGCPKTGQYSYSGSAVKCSFHDPYFSAVNDIVSITKDFLETLPGVLAQLKADHFKFTPGIVQSADKAETYYSYSSGDLMNKVIQNTGSADTTTLLNQIASQFKLSGGMKDTLTTTLKSSSSYRIVLTADKASVAGIVYKDPIHPGNWVFTYSDGESYSVGNSVASAPQLQCRYASDKEALLATGVTVKLP